MFKSFTRKGVELAFSRWAKQFDDHRSVLHVALRPDNQFAGALFIGEDAEHPFIALLRVGSGKPVVPADSHELWATGYSLWWPQNDMSIELSDGHNGLCRYAIAENLAAVTPVGNVTPAEGEQKSIEWYCKLSPSGVHWHRLREYHCGRAEVIDDLGWLFHYESMLDARTNLPSGYFNIADYDVEALIEKDRVETETMLNRVPFPEPGAPEKLFNAYFGRKRAEIPDEEYEKARAIRHRLNANCWQAHREDAQRLRYLKVSPPMAADRKELAKLMQQRMD